MRTYWDKFVKIRLKTALNEPSLPKIFELIAPLILIAYPNDIITDFPNEVVPKLIDHDEQFTV